MMKKEKVNCYCCHALIRPEQQDKDNRCPKCKEWNICRVCDMVHKDVLESNDMRCYNCKDMSIDEIAIYVGEHKCSSGYGWFAGMSVAVDRAIEEARREIRLNNKRGKK